MIDEKTKATLEAQEVKQDKEIRYELFKNILLLEFKEEAIEEFWAIMEKRDMEHWESRLTEVLGMMDKEDRHYIIAVYHNVQE
jgi:thioredoxin-like negative regulator of GroEL